MDNKRTVLYLCRHGEVADEHRSSGYGHLDIPLSGRGVEQSKILADSLVRVPLDAVYSSDLVRAAYAAELIAAGRDLAPTFTPEFREIGMGDWEGQKVKELSQAFPELVSVLVTDPWQFRFPGGESFQEFGARVNTALTDILNSDLRVVALVGHAGVCRLILGSVLGVPASNWLRISQDFGCVNIIEWVNGLPVVKLMNQLPAAKRLP
jgi:broad specificity phosphatase PhoE